MAASNSDTKKQISDDTPPAAWAANDLQKQAQLTETMKQAGISRVAIATVAEGRLESQGEFPVLPGGAKTDNTVFGAASLSKPVFAYLVLKLIEKNNNGKAEPGAGPFTLPDGLERFDLDTPLHLIVPLSDIDSEVKGVPKLDTSDEANVEAAKKLTARMVLSHQTGLESGALQFQFKPGEGHGYSNAAILYLQKVIKQLTNSDLETLAKQHVFTPCKMEHSSYICDKTKPQNTWDALAINSLHTTASDYARFVNEWMHDETLQEAFVPQVFMTEDKGRAGKIAVVKGQLQDADLEHVAWGLGWGLQTDEQDKNKAVTAYHSGDMNEWRAWVAMNLTDKTATVFFANSHNGHVLAEQIIPDSIQMNHVFNYFFPKWDFARKVDDLRSDWRETPSWGLAKPDAVLVAERSPGQEPQETQVKQSASGLSAMSTPASSAEVDITRQFRGSVNEIRTSSLPGESELSSEQEERRESRHLFDPTKITPKSPTDV